MKLALHRSITFWSGILVMGFICWVWRDSQSYWTYSRVMRLTVYQCPSAVRFGFIPVSAPPYFDRETYSPGVIEREFLPMPFLRSGGAKIADQAFWDEHVKKRRWRDVIWNFCETESPKSWTAFIPHWLLLLIVAVPWTALPLWRARRRRKIITA